MAAQSSSEAVVTVDVHTAKDLLASGQYSYLDVRIPELFNKGHVENALNVPFFLSTPEGRVKNPLFLEQVSSLCSKDDPLLVGCYSGGRSMLASVDLLNAGFKNTKNVGGGHSAWVEKGFPVQKATAEQ
ncbi:thiosulfate sulfurtransferase 18-like [Aristolochia californica]|uniref:thiosulfate sulfurtransferase 18-like n=1 Tax=Aristolochia californica TaxID=171875 RepID=UPI0035DB5406